MLMTHDWYMIYDITGYNMITAVYSKSHCGKYEGDKYDVIAWFTHIPIMRDLRSTRYFYYVYIGTMIWPLMEYLQTN